MWQHKLANPLGIVAGLGIPTAIGWAFGDPIGGLLWGGFLRVVVIHHTTFFVNSIAHLYGSRPYTEENSARDNPLLAFVTIGEGFHYFHHRFPSDFRNGIRWYHWDPTKWLIGALGKVGLARRLRTTPQLVIERTRLQTALGRAEVRLATAPSQIREADPDPARRRSPFAGARRRHVERTPGEEPQGLEGVPRARRFGARAQACGAPDAGAGARQA